MGQAGCKKEVQAMTSGRPSDSDPITIKVVEILSQAEFCKSMLEANEIPTAIIDAHTIMMYPHLNYAVGGIKIQVRRADVARATELLGDVDFASFIGTSGTVKLREGEDTVVAECHDCKHRFDVAKRLVGKISVCPNCNVYIDVEDASAP